jgi:hybrid cluster-associated redox disulfide protein
MSGPDISTDDTVAQALERHPEVAVVFVRLGMACVGCDMAPFDTVGDAAAAYDRAPEELASELNRATGAQDSRKRHP